ncbi:MAG: ribosome recycling factor [Candidatus Berkelbacteria bacterium]|nr:ribosome recycling factor [Candidatus Berkelbacteria bacterium]
MYQQEIKTLKQKFDQIAGRLSEDLATVRTGRASTSLVENITVSYYGSTAPLKQMATLSTPDPSQIVIQPWDKNSLGDIELAIRNSDLNLSPVNDGNAVRVVLPPMTQERRDELIRNIHRKGEEARVALRSVRQDSWEKVKKMEKDKKITEDDRYAAEKELNELIDSYNQKVEEAIVNKEKELRSI